MCGWQVCVCGELFPDIASEAGGSTLTVMVHSPESKCGERSSNGLQAAQKSARVASNDIIMTYRIIALLGSMLLTATMLANACTLPSDGPDLNYTDLGSTIRDNVTELTWQKTSNQTYTRQYSYAQAVAALPAGMRLPTLPEAWSIVNFGQRYPAIGPIFGPIVSNPNGMHVNYWTGTTAPSGMMVVNFNGGGSGPLPSTANAYLRGVSGTWNCLPFTPRDNGDSTWTVPSTGQMWTHPAGSYTWNQLPFLAGGCYAGYCDWRPPQAKELETIVSIVGPWAWSGTAEVGALPPTCAWGLNGADWVFHNGRTSLHGVWLVRN